MKNLLFTLFLICICFIESNGGIENNVSFKDTQAQPKDSVWVTIVNAWEWNATQEEVNQINSFKESSDSSWSEIDEGWHMVFFTNTAFDTVAVFETDPDGDKGYQFLFYTKE